MSSERPQIRDSAWGGQEPRVCALLLFLLSLMMIGCNTDDRVSRLEKQMKELRQDQAKQQSAAEYELEEKCSREAKAWFRENWAREKNTTFLDYTNHYNKGL